MNGNALSRCETSSPWREARNFWCKCQRDYGGNSIIRDINERGEDNFASGAAVDGSYEMLHHSVIHSERHFPRRWEILLNFHDTELDCFAGSQVNLR